MPRMLITGAAALAAAFLVSQANAAPPTSLFDAFGIAGPTFMEKTTTIKNQVFATANRGQVDIINGNARIGGNDYLHHNPDVVAAGQCQSNIDFVSAPALPTPDRGTVRVITAKTSGDDGYQVSGTDMLSTGISSGIIDPAAADEIAIKAAIDDGATLTVAKLAQTWDAMTSILENTAGHPQALQ